MSEIKRFLNLRKMSRVFWAMVVLFLPVTSFKYFPFLGKETMVRPLSFYPLAILVILLFIRIIKGDLKFKMNGSLLIYALFLAVAFTATIFGAVMDPIQMHGQDYSGRAIRAWMTLAGGLAFFVSAMLMNQEKDDLYFTLKWLYIGLAASIVWGGIQMISYYTDFPGRQSLNVIQKSFSIRQLLAKKRAAGFAYEPSWLANQLATIYLPWLFASLISGYRVFKRRWLEPVIFVGALALLLCTFSRGGIVMAAISCGLVFLITQARLIKMAWVWFVYLDVKGLTSAQKIYAVGLRVGIMAVCAGLISGVFLVLSTSPYFSKIWKSNKTNLVDYMVDIYAGPRLAYAIAGMEIYERYPLTGVGLGATGLYLYDYIPEWSKTTLSEIAKHLGPNAWLYPNAKNQLIRVLAETGLIGFGLYLLFYLNILGQILAMLRSQNQLGIYLATTGLTTWIVLMIFNFTQDSFIDPNGWMNLGILLAFLSGTGKRQTHTKKETRVP